MWHAERIRSDGRRWLVVNCETVYSDYDTPYMYVCAAPYETEQGEGTYTFR